MGVEITKGVNDKTMNHGGLSDISLYVVLREKQILIKLKFRFINE